LGLFWLNDQVDSIERLHSDNPGGHVGGNFVDT
jgi:hypothetical protein